MKRPLPKRTPISGPNPEWAQAKPLPPDSRPRCGRFLTCSEAFLRACWVLDASDESGYFLESYPVADYVLAHGLELALKAFLGARGWTVGDLRRVSHDLEVALKAANEAGLAQYVPVSTEERLTLMALNEPYAAKHLEYLDTGHSGMFSGHRTLLLFLVRLLDGLWEPCGVSDIEAEEDRAQADLFRHRFTDWREREMKSGDQLRVEHALLGPGVVGFFRNALSERSDFIDSTFFLIEMDSGFRGAGSLDVTDKKDGLDRWLARRGMER